MSLLQVGFPRSGNFWLYRILEQLLRRAGIEQRRFICTHPVHSEALTWDLGGPERADMDMIDIRPRGCDFRIGQRFKEPVLDLDAYIAASSHVCSHSAWCESSAEVLDRFAHVVYVARDPRDAIVSLSRYAFTDYMLAYHPPREKDPRRYLARRHRRLARAWSRHVSGYLDNAEGAHVHVVRYEGLLENFAGEIGALLNYLELPLDDNDLGSLSLEVGFEAMRPDAPEHLRRGVAGAWSDVLTRGQQRRIRRIAAETMARLGAVSDQR